MNKKVAESSISNESDSQSDEYTPFQPQSCGKLKECGGQTEGTSRTEESDAPDREAISLESAVQGLTVAGYTCLTECYAELEFSEESSSISDAAALSTVHYSQSSTGGQILPYFHGPSTSKALEPCCTVAESYTFLTKSDAEAVASEESSSKFLNVAFLEQQNIHMKAVLKEQRNALESMLASFEKVTEDNIRVVAEMKDQSEQIEDNETVTITVGDYLLLMEVTVQDIKQVITKAEHVQNVVAETFKIVQFLKSYTEYIIPDLRSIRKQAFQLKKLDELYISCVLGKLLTCINGVAMYVPRISTIVSNVRANFTKCIAASSNFENEVENMVKKLKKAHMCFNGITKILKLSRAGALDGFDIIMTKISETTTTLTEDIRNFAESFHLPSELARYLCNRGDEITSLNYIATEVVRDQLERRTDAPIQETIIHLKTISHEMWTTVEQIIAGANTLISKLSASKETAKALFAQSKNIHKEINKMQEFISEITRLRENARHQHDDPPIAENVACPIGQEIWTIRVLQQENRELKLTLEEHQNALDMIISKYRHLTKLKGSSRIDFEFIIQQAYNIKEIADEAVQVDDYEAPTIKEEIQRLVNENKELRELLSMSTNFQQSASLDKDDAHQD